MPTSPCPGGGVAAATSQRLLLAQLSHEWSLRPSLRGQVDERGVNTSALAAALSSTKARGEGEGDGGAAGVAVRSDSCYPYLDAKITGICTYNFHGDFFHMIKTLNSFSLAHTFLLFVEKHHAHQRMDTSRQEKNCRQRNVIHSQDRLSFLRRQKDRISWRSPNKALSSTSCTPRGTAPRVATAS